VLAVRPLISSALTPFALLLSGVLADNVFEPAMQGELGRVLEPLLGTGDGRGYALMFVLAGLCQALCGLSGYMLPRSRKVESELPDALAAD
jgi:DHA3 family macrolide efflux protein-like MFS transporter